MNKMKCTCSTGEKLFLFYFTEVPLGGFLCKGVFRYNLVKAIKRTINVK